MADSIPPPSDLGAVVSEEPDGGSLHGCRNMGVRYPALVKACKSWLRVKRKSLGLLKIRGSGIRSGQTDRKRMTDMPPVGLSGMAGRSSRLEGNTGTYALPDMPTISGP